MVPGQLTANDALPTVTSKVCMNHVKRYNYNRFRKLTAKKEQKLFINEDTALSFCEIASINFVKAIE